MELGALLGRQRRRRFGVVGAAGTAGGIAAGAAMAAWLLDARGTGRRSAFAQRARAVLDRTDERLRRARAAAEARTREAEERARSLAKAGREAASRVQSSGLLAPLRGPWSPGRARLVAGSAGTFLLGRALLGHGLARVPAAILGARVLSRLLSGLEATRTLERRRAQRARSRAEKAAQQDRAEARGHVGAWHPGAEAGPEVVEVKSPAELQPGIASATPEPTFASHVDRGARGQRSGRKQAGARRKRAASPSARVTPPGSEDVERRAEYVSPPEGAGVRGDDLGKLAAREDDSGGEREDEPVRRDEPGERG